MLYTPYIDGAMEYIQRIYSWNQRVDEMRKEAIKNDKFAKCSQYNFNNGLRLLYEEKNEYTEARLSGDTEEMIDALVDQFVVAIGEIRKCALSESYEHIEFWESRAKEAYWQLTDLIQSYNRASNIEEMLANDELLHRCFREVIDALLTRFGDDAYIDENGKFIKSKGYTKPDLSFLLK